jgi:hypothetical protein
MTGLLPSSLLFVLPTRVLRAPPPLAYSSLISYFMLAGIGYRCSVPHRVEDDREE